MKCNITSRLEKSIPAIFLIAASCALQAFAYQLPDPRVEALRDRIPNDSNVARIAGFSAALVKLIDADTAYLKAAQDKDASELVEADLEKAEALNCAMQIVNREKLGSAGIKLVQQVHTTALTNPPGLMLTASEMQQQIPQRERIVMMSKPVKPCS